jgi:hypothetical protein
VTEWPEAPALRACIAWNETERKRALGDVTNTALRVPVYAHKMVKGERVALTVEEYRENRAADAERYKRNIAALRERL